MGLPFWQPADCCVQFDIDFVMKCWLIKYLSIYHVQRLNGDQTRDGEYERSLVNSCIGYCLQNVHSAEPGTTSL